jgi:hypothetical protein
LINSLVANKQNKQLKPCKNSNVTSKKGITIEKENWIFVSKKGDKECCDVRIRTDTDITNIKKVNDVAQNYKGTTNSKRSNDSISYVKNTTKSDVKCDDDNKIAKSRNKNKQKKHDELSLQIRADLKKKIFDKLDQYDRELRTKKGC